MTLLIRGGHIVNEGRIWEGDIVVEDGRIAELTPHPSPLTPHSSLHTPHSTPL